MRKKLLQMCQILLTLTLMSLFSVFVFAQGGTAARPESETETAVRIIGWLTIVGAGVTYVTLNIYNAIRGKNYEQLKEASVNYKELAESRKAQVAERDAAISTLRADNIHLETENERLSEKILRL